LATTLSLASNPAIPTMAQAAHLTAVLPTVSLGGGGSLASPTAAATASQLAAAAAAAAANHAAAGGGPNPYQGYNLANVDMSSFQGIDWSSMYGMGMYV
jgi:RNA-binding protein Musashi